MLSRRIQFGNVSNGTVFMLFFLCLSVVDAFGKLPSAIFDGNFYELGGFTECFHIQRNEVPYKTQYCMANLIFDINLAGIPKPRSNQHDILNMPRTFHANPNFLIDSRAALSR